MRPTLLPWSTADDDADDPFSEARGSRLETGINSNNGEFLPLKHLLHKFVACAHAWVALVTKRMTGGGAQPSLETLPDDVFSSCLYCKGRLCDTECEVTLKSRHTKRGLWHHLPISAVSRRCIQLKADDTVKVVGLIFRRKPQTAPVMLYFPRTNDTVQEAWDKSAAALADGNIGKLWNTIIIQWHYRRKP